VDRDVIEKYWSSEGALLRVLTGVPGSEEKKIQRGKER
jgi:hypothetical protein